MRPLKNACEIAVVGGGLAGLSCARHASRLGRPVTLFERSGLFGGQLATIGEVDGLLVPGKHSGQDLAQHLLTDARETAALQVVEANVTGIDVNGRLTVTDERGRTYHPEALVIASGASLRSLGIGEEAFVGRGVSRCATCDGGFFRDQDVVVVGGGDSAAQEALALAGTSRRVMVVCRSPLTAKRDYIEKLAARENVSFIWDTEVSAILGDDGVCGVRLRNVKDGTLSEVKCTGLFPFIGVVPNTGFVPPCWLSATGHVETNAALATADARVLAAGAARAGYGGNVLEAMAEGMRAAEAAARLRKH